MFKCYGMDCLGTYSHMPKPNVTRVQSASQWTASVLTLHMPKPNVTRVQSASSLLEAPFKPPSSPLEASLKPSEGEAPFDLQIFVPPPTSGPQTLQAPLKGASEGGTSEPAPLFAARLLPTLKGSRKEENSEIGSERGRSFCNSPGSASR